MRKFNMQAHTRSETHLHMQANPHASQTHAYSHTHTHAHTLSLTGNATAGVIVRLWGWDQFLTLYLAILLALFVCNCVYHAYVVISYRCVAPPSLECSKLLITRSR